MSVVLERGQAGMLASSVVVAGVALAGGAFLGGYALGDTPAPPPQTELAEKMYTTEDLTASLAACNIDGVAAEQGSVTLIGAEWPALNRQCFVAEMGAPELADRDYTGQIAVEGSGGAEYTWSNVHMVWEQTRDGRDVTISIS